MRARPAPLDNFPLEPGMAPGLAFAAPAAQAGATVRANCQRLPLDLDAPPEILPRRAYDPADEPPPSRQRVRPLTRFAKPEESPNFYLSLSDIMCLLLVFFVLIFSLSKPWPQPGDRPDGPPAAERALRVVQGSIPGFTASRPDPGDLPGAREEAAQLEMGIVAVSATGSADPGLKKAAQGEMAQPPLLAAGDRGTGAEAQPISVPASLIAMVSAAEEHPEPTLLLPKDLAEPPAHPQAAPEQTLASSGAANPADARDGAAEGPTDELLAKVSGQAKAGALPGITVTRQSDRLLLLLPERITFDTAQAEIKPEMKAVLGRLAKALGAYPRARVVVTGHTDDRPISTDQFASNWELSAARAAAVARALAGQGLARERVAIRGLADLKPIAPNTSEDNRRRNRRVEIELRV